MTFIEELHEITSKHPNRKIERETEELLIKQAEEAIVEIKEQILKMARQGYTYHSYKCTLMLGTKIIELMKDELKCHYNEGYHQCEFYWLNLRS